MIKCLIADDEVLSLEVLEGYIGKLENYKLIASCRNGLEVFNALKNQSVDLLFLDIQMPQLSGLELAKSFTGLPAIIFTTAFREYAVEGYELNALDYLLKPISFDRFLRAIDKFENTSSHSINRRSDTQELKTARSNDFVYVKSAKKTVKVYLKDIIFIQGAKEFVKILTVHGEVITYQTLQDFEQRLPDGLFLRVHRSFIIAVDQIRAYNATHLEVGDTEIPIGQSYQKLVRDALKL